MCVWELLGVGGRGDGSSGAEGGGEVALSIVLQTRPRRPHVGPGWGAADRSALGPGAFLSIFMECKRSFCFIIFFFCKA